MMQPLLNVDTALANILADMKTIAGGDCLAT